MQQFAQDTIDTPAIYPAGIFISYGIGPYSVRDDYISKERYSGLLPYYNVEWVHFKKKNGYRLQFEYRITQDISNNNISADAQQFSFNQDFIYSIGNFPLFSSPVYAYLGPSVQAFYYEIQYRFADPGTFISPVTNGVIGSLGVNAALVYKVNRKFLAEAFLRSNLISVTGKKINDDEHPNESNPALLTMVTATKLDLELSFRYYMLERLSVSLGYKFDLSRINKWDPYSAVSNSLIIGLNVRI